MHSSKRKRDNDIWTPITDINNYIANDGYLDYLKVYENINSRNLFLEILTEKSGIFKSNMLDTLIQRFGQSKCKLFYDTSNSDIVYEQTLKEMKKGTPVIYSGLVRDFKNNFYGYPDLLIRGDYLEKWLGIEIDKQKYHVVQLNYGTITLLTDNKVSNKHLQVKVLVSFYSRCIGQEIGYVFGKKYKTKSEAKHNFGRVDVCCQKLDRGIEWLSILKKQSFDLNVLPLTNENLYPNMCNSLDHPFFEKKLDFANKIGEITLVWNCGVKHRKNAHRHGVYSWRDKKCSASILGLPKKVGRIVDKILEVNKSKEFYLPKIIEMEKKDFSFFVDFETACPALVDHAIPFVFMIGCTFLGQHVRFVADRLDVQSETVMALNFVTFLVNKNIENVYLYHWGSAEPTSWKKLVERSNNSVLRDFKLCWIDLYQVFVTIPIVVRGALDFGLKSIAKALYSHGFIKTTWTSECENGQDASAKAVVAYKQVEIQAIPVEKHVYMMDIEKYNRIDCQVLYEILSFIHLSRG